MRLHQRRRRDWIAKIVEDDEEPEAEPYVILYCPACAEREFYEAHATATTDASTDGDGQPPDQQM